MTKISIGLSSETEEKLRGIAEDGNLPLRRACEIILSEFARLEGGHIYVGEWKEGDGLRFVVQWPFLTGLVKRTGEQLEKIGVK